MNDVSDRGATIGKRKIGLGEFISAAGLFSAFSLLLVLPYTIGYFYYFDIKYLSLFSLTDYYFFSIAPLILGFFILGFIGVIWFLSQKTLPIAEEKRRQALMGILFGLVFGLVICSPFFSKGVVLASSLSLCLLACVIFFELRLLRSVVAVVVITILCEAVLLVFGFMRAERNFLNNDVIEILQKETTRKGRSIFIGANAVLWINSNERIIFSRLDQEVSISLGVATNRGVLDCLDLGIFQLIRSVVGKKDCS